MARKFFTADLHLGHGNIAIYTDRPWVKPRHIDPDTGWWRSDTECREATELMNKNLIKRWNERVSPEDTVFHIGDFCTRGRARGSEGSRKKADDYEQELNGKIIHILGNHDSNNGVRHGLSRAYIEMGNMEFLLRHIPIRSEEIAAYRDTIVLCGHVHTAWEYKHIPEYNIYQLNIGVDVHHYYPISQSELLDWLTKIKNSVPE